MLTINAGPFIIINRNPKTTKAGKTMKNQTIYHNPYTNHTIKDNTVHHTPIKVPANSRPGLIAEKAGRCECCGGQFNADDIIIRLPRKTGRKNKFGIETYTGIKVCRYCSPFYEDGILERYEYPITYWYSSWTTGSHNKSAKPGLTNINPRLINQNRKE